ncbi:MAG: hypothetical protein QOG51_1697 [Verrucomicrobiota bacterium]|jgi:photosystem II stability/assembly factor-like uncharacterized protein
MNFIISPLARRKTRRIIGVVIPWWVVVLSANAQLGLPVAEKKPREFSEMPARRFIENLPPTPNLPPSTKRARSVPAFEAISETAPSWLALGPFPIPNGQTENRVDPVSGRVTAIAVHPSNPLIAYVGTAQGGLYRTLDGGTSWTQLMDNASSGFIGTPLAIGSVTIDPTSPGNVLVGTGEGNLSGDSFFGSGLYIITNADTFNPIVKGPYNLRASDNADIFTGRSIVAIAVDPANHNNVFCATSLGVGGIVPAAYSVLPPRGLYRSTNAFAGTENTGTPVFARVSVESSETNAIITDAVIEPGNANNLVCALYSQSGTDTTGGIYRTTNALSATPTFTRTLGLPDFTNAKLAINKVGETVTVYVASEEGLPNGKLYKSTDGGATFGPALAGAKGFAGVQGFYDIAIALDPSNADRVYVGGNTGDNIFLYSTNGGTSFNFSTTGLHADVHAIAIAPSNTAVIYHGNDGGIWRSTNFGSNWTSLNNNTFSATQFQSLAIHPIDHNFSIGGTQDNGTEFLSRNGGFTRADFGDGGYALIDQNAIDPSSVTMYHTYFNQTNLVIGTARVLNSSCAFEGGWSFRGIYGGTVDSTMNCDSMDQFNGIELTDAVNFYAPQVLGPGNPNTWYFGTDKLYRSIDRADTAIVASQLLESGMPISAIAISPQDDNVRVVGLNNGKVFATTTGAPTLLQIAGAGATNGTTGTPAAGVGRIAIDPNNKNVAYLCFNGFGTPASPINHVWKTTNLTAVSVNFAPMSAGLPDIPVNAVVIDAVTLSGGSSTDIYVGTDAGVYYSPNAGASWTVYGSGFPHVAVFGLEIQSPARVIRAATHGRGMYETSTVSTATPTPAPTPTPTPTPGTDFSTKLRNVSTRGPVETGNNVMIAGFIITGDSKQVVLRGLGPSLTQFGVPDAIGDPTLTLNDANGSLIAYNDDYTAASSADRATLAANKLTPTDSRESAIVSILAPTAYTAILRGKTNGNGLVEVYDVAASASSQLVNISTRLKVGPGDNGALIAGFILAAPPERPGTAQRIAIRAIGPSLKNFGITNALADTTLDLYRGSQLILSNDNWKTNSAQDQQTLQSNGLAPTNDKEAALVSILDPGSYSAVVRGKGTLTGVALVEVYNLTQ